MTSLKVATRVLIVEDHPLVADALRRLISSAEDIEVVGVVATAAEAILASTTFRPDVLVMDFHLPGGSGAEAAKAIRYSSPTTAIIFLSADQDASVVAEAVEAGALGYLYKGSEPHLIVDAVRRVAAGEVLISVASRDRLSRQHRAIATTAGRNARDLDQLTQREKEVLGCVCAGWENQDIAGELGISLTTVSWHVRNILGKLGVRSKWEASIRAAALGFRGVEVRAEG